MDKELILAVAGSGKTTYLIDKLNEKDRFLLITYTNANTENLRSGVIQKFGYFPENIKLYTYFSFLYSFCYKPYLSRKVQAKGISFDQLHSRLRFKSDNLGYYITKNRRLYSCRIARLLKQCDIYPLLRKRLEKYFGYIFVDEVQDFAGHDFNLLMELTESNVKMKLVGDFNQHTFDTSRDGAVNKNLHKDFDQFVDRFKKKKVSIRTDILSNSYRCSPTVCNFITENLEINISSHKLDPTVVKLEKDKSISIRLAEDANIIKLFYQNSVKYNCYSLNWGKSKGMNCFKDICVVLNKKTMEYMLKEKLMQLPEATKHKLYVAISRAHGNVYFIDENSLISYKR